MIVEFDKSFNKSIIRLKDKSIALKLEKLIELLESIDTISKAPNSKKLTGFQVYYRIRIGDYRVGIEKINDKTIRLITVAHRKEIYKIFP
ncbi:MAG: type II toxin-antitoxin system RelE/ParE family toxin [Bacteroidetes bacterium]|nr:type II toxin-antitoxin system RelE/ParE family toxin [Bacteroidota bacterium]